MALNAYEQLRVVDGIASPEQNTLDELVHQVGTAYAEDFQKEYKLFVTDDPPTEEQTLANSYLNKMLRVCAGMYRADGAAINSLKRICVVLLGELAPDYDFVENMGDDIWENFVTLTMRDAFELSGGVKREEKTAYNTITEL